MGIKRRYVERELRRQTSYHPVRSSKKVTVQPKPAAFSKRKKALTNLAYSTFIHNVPFGYEKQFVKGKATLNDHAKNRINALAMKGGAEYEHAIEALKFAYTPIGLPEDTDVSRVGELKDRREVWFDPRPYQEALEVLGSPNALLISMGVKAKELKDLVPSKSFGH